MKPSLEAGVASVGALEVGASAVSGHAVANSAEVLEDLLTLAGVTFDFLSFWSHFFC